MVLRKSSAPNPDLQGDLRKRRMVFLAFHEELQIFLIKSYERRINQSLV